jgi:hypothetical protein
MYTKEQVDEMLSQVEQEFENALGSIAKSEENIEEVNEIEVEAQESEELEKSEETEVEAEEEDYETIDDLYASMTKSEQEAHYAAVKKSLYGEEVEAQQEQKENEEQTLEKSEETEVETKEVQMLKSENEDLKKSYEELKNMVDQLFNVKKAPAQKAVTNVNYIAKSEESNSEEIDFSEMSKNEITAKLKTIDYSGLKKSDREAINNYYLDNGSVDSIKHLIRE